MTLITYISSSKALFLQIKFQVKGTAVDADFQHCSPSATHPNPGRGQLIALLPITMPRAGPAFYLGRDFLLHLTELGPCEGGKSRRGLKPESAAWGPRACSEPVTAQREGAMEFL